MFPQPNVPVQNHHTSVPTRGLLPACCEHTQVRVGSAISIRNFRISFSLQGLLAPRAAVCGQSLLSPSLEQGMKVEGEKSGQRACPLCTFITERCTGELGRRVWALEEQMSSHQWPTCPEQCCLISNTVSCPSARITSVLVFLSESTVTELHWQSLGAVSHL